MKVLQWNTDKKHRCPQCHAIAVLGPKSWEVYECCRCGVRFTRWPRLARIFPFRGVVCHVHGSHAS